MSIKIIMGRKKKKTHTLKYYEIFFILCVNVLKKDKGIYVLL